MSYTPTIKIKMRAVEGSASGSDAFKEIAKDLFLLASPKTRVRAMIAASMAAKDAVRNYYSEKGRRLWVKPGGPTHGPGRKQTQWWRQIEGLWKSERPTARKATLTNNAIGFAHKVTGGVIRAKRKKFLTIPVIPQAHGLTARTFSKTIAPLFATKNALSMSTADGGVKAVFVLKKQVKQERTKNALPEVREFMPIFEDVILDVLEAHAAGTWPNPSPDSKMKNNKFIRMTKPK